MEKVKHFLVRLKFQMLVGDNLKIIAFIQDLET